MHAGDDREVPPIFRNFAPSQIWYFAKPGFRGTVKGFYGRRVVCHAHCVSVEGVVLRLCVDQNRVVFAFKS